MNTTDHTPGAAGWPPVESGRLVIGSPADVVSAVPYMLGFHPSDSIVVIGFDGPSETAAFRIDVPDPGREAEQAADRTVEILTSNAYPRALLIGYGPGQLVTPVIDVFTRVLRRDGVAVVEALRVHEGRWFSYLCADPQCCPPEGTAVDISSSVIAAQATVAGQVALADRSELAASIAPVTGPVRDTIDQATARVELLLLTRQLESYLHTDQPLPASRRRPADPRVTLGVPLVRDLLVSGRFEEFLADADQVALLSVVLTHIRVRDEAWVRIDPDQPGPPIALWREVLRRVDDRYAAAPASLLAFAAYMAGDGALANIALDRAFQADPHYTMADLLRAVIQAGIPPTAARLRITPEELTQEWDELDRTHPTETSDGTPEDSDVHPDD